MSDFFTNNTSGQSQISTLRQEETQGFSPAPGKTSRTSSLPPSLLWDQEAGRAIGRANKHLDELDALIPSAKSALESVQFHEAKAAIGRLQSKL